MAKPKPTRGARNIAWIESNCRVPEGRLVGKPVKLRPWQRDEIRRIYDNPARTRRAIVSFGRKNGKTALAAMLLLLRLCGPEARPNSQLYSAAQSREQAAILFSLAAKMVRLNPELARYVVPKDTAKVLACPELGTQYRALSADASTAYGLSPVFTVHDELGQVKGPRSELYEALETASAAHDDPLSIVISTQAPTDADLLSVLIDDAATGADPRVTLALYTAAESLDPFSDDALRAANPAFGDFQSAEEVRAMAADAKRMPSREAEFRNLVLNQRVEAVSPFVSRSVWQSNGGDVLESFAGLPVYIGLDLAETSDLTALVQVAPVERMWHIKPTFWLPGEGLAEKARKDRVPYDLWHAQGLLETTPGRAVEYSFVAKRLRMLFDVLDIRQVAFDRYNMRHLLPWLQAEGFTEAELLRFVEFGQGFVGMGPAPSRPASARQSSAVPRRPGGGALPVRPGSANAASCQAVRAGNLALTDQAQTDGALMLCRAGLISTV